jgi:D-alanyl-D-alanine carboxypeptidase
MPARDGRGVCGFIGRQEGNVMRAALHARNGRTGVRWLRGIQPLALLACALFSACASTQMAPQRANGAGSGAEERTSSRTNAPRPYSALLPAPALSATAYMLIDPTSGVVYLSHNARAELPMASTTKIMTALVALTFGSLDQRIAVGADAAALVGSEASVAGLRAGDVLTLRELLYGLMLPSGDDAAVAIADGVSGSQDHFVALMNTEAALLGLWHTHYADVHGLDAPGHYTTAGDLATLARSAMRLTAFRTVVGTAVYQLNAGASHQAYTWTTTNKLLTSRLYPGVIGIKTGFTGNAGECLVFAARRPQGQLLGVVLGAPDDDARFSDAAALLDWGFVVADAARRYPGSGYIAGS